MQVFRGLLGMVVVVGIGWLLSENRRRVNWRFIAGGIALQLLLAALLLGVPIFQSFFLMLNRAVLVLDAATGAGTAFVFGYAGGAPLPFEEITPGGAFIFGFRALPLVLLISALSALLFHWGVLQRVVGFFALMLRKVLGIGGVEAFGVAANIFVGMVEAPLLIRPYIKRLSRCELFAIMVSGMATIAGTVMALYAALLGRLMPDVMGHILTASLMSAPAALVMARLLVPRDAEACTEGTQTGKSPYGGSMDAIVQGTMQGVELLIGIVGMLIVLLALVFLFNACLGVLPSVGGAPLTLQRGLGWLMAPLVWILGVPWAEAGTAGQLMGTKTILNELLAYVEMAQLPEGALSRRTIIILTYAMCGFANPGSLGIMLGGLRTIAPERSEEITRLGLRSVLAGTLAACMTGAIAGMLIK